MRNDILASAYITVGAGLLVAGLLMLTLDWSPEAAFVFTGGGLIVRGMFE
jgi:hypothetical protein